MWITNLKKLHEKLWLPTIVSTVLAVGCSKPLSPDIGLSEACKKGYIQDVKQHIAAGTDVNALPPNNSHKGPPIMDASENGFSEIVDLLLKAGADPNVENSYGKTSLHLAANKAHKKVVELLIAHGADVNAKVKSGNVSGLTPLDAARSKSRHSGDYKVREEIVTILLKYGGKSGADLK